MAKLSENASILEINNIIVLGLISNKISKTININGLDIVRIGRVNAKIKEALITSIFFIENLLISMYMYGVINKVRITSDANKHVNTKLYFAVEKNFILE
ncbi:MAG: hypothetical protein ACREV6_19255 [Clostridium sp.]|uniref:hypothetical protein n=1 Tax=Clostridium sp. TaxID=1506 RepID=UPI003D6D24D9